MSDPTVPLVLELLILTGVSPNAPLSSGCTAVVRYLNSCLISSENTDFVANIQPSNNLCTAGSPECCSDPAVSVFMISSQLFKHLNEQELAKGLPIGLPQGLGINCTAATFGF